MDMFARVGRALGDIVCISVVLDVWGGQRSSRRTQQFRGVSWGLQSVSYNRVRRCAVCGEGCEGQIVRMSDSRSFLGKYMLRHLLVYTHC